MKEVIMMLLALTVIKTARAWDAEMEDIVITPSRIVETAGETGRKVDIISPKKLKYLNPKGISEVLKYSPSVTINDYGSLGAEKTIQMRGSTPSQVLVLVDGRPINSPRSGDVSLNNIALEDIAKIEVLRGPASSLYGSGAMGGVVNILTREPPDEGQETELTSSFGTFRTYQERLSHGAKLRNFGYRINTGYQSSQGHRDNAEFNAKEASAKLTYEFNPQNLLTLNSGFSKDKLGTPGTIASPDLNDRQMNRKNFLDLLWEVKPWEDKDIELSGRLYQNYDRLEFVETPEPLDKTTHSTKSRALNLKYNQKISELYRLIFGLDLTDNHNDSSKTAKHSYVVRAGYLENQFQPWEKLNVNLGLRLDDYSNFGSNVSPSLSLLYKLKGEARFHFLIARSFRAPTFNDLYWPATGVEEGNPNLQPEKGITFELGIEKEFSKFFKIGLTYFRSNYDKLIKWQQDPIIFRPKNIDAATIQGLEQEVSISPLDYLDIKMSYTYLLAKDDKTHKYLTYQPKHKASLSLNYKGKAGLNAGLEGQFVDRSFDNAANSRYVKRYYVVGLRVSQEINDEINIFIKIDNLLNKKYQIRRRYPLPGLSVTSGIKLKF